MNDWNSNHNIHEIQMKTVDICESLSSGSALNDGQWHSVELMSRRGHLTVTVDGDEGASAHASPSFPVTTGSQLFFGGQTDERMHNQAFVLGFGRLMSFPLLLQDVLLKTAARSVWTPSGFSRAACVCWLWTTNWWTWSWCSKGWWETTVTCRSTCVASLTGKFVF